jgi:hypothetical protein
MKEAISAPLQISASSLVLTETSGPSIIHIYKDDEKLPIAFANYSTNLMAFELEPSPHQILVKVEVMGKTRHLFHSASANGPPFPIYVGRTCTLQELYSVCWERLRVFCTEEPKKEPEPTSWINLSRKEYLHTESLQGLPLHHVIELTSNCTIIVEWSKPMKESFLVSLDFNFTDFPSIGSLIVQKAESPSNRSFVDPETSTRAGSLGECFTEFVKTENLGQSNLWSCPFCQVLVEASKKMDVVRLPQVLVIHLKRFASTRTSSSGSKINTLVTFPLSFDACTYVTPQESSPLWYDLYAVCVSLSGLSR